MRCPGSFARGSVAVLAFTTATAFAASTSAEGKPTLSGSWSASPVSESFSFGNWVDACGPKPRGQGGGGGSVQIREQGGELSIVGAGRAWSTAECWEQAPGLGRVSHSQSGGGRFWRTRCSLSNEKQRITVTTTVSATDSSITMQETSEHQVTAEGVTCTATASRSRSFGLVKREGEEAAPSASASASASAAPSSPPADAAASGAPSAPPAPKARPIGITSPRKDDAPIPAGPRDPEGAERGDAAATATGAVGGRKGVADDVGRERKQTFVAIVIGLAFVLGFAGLVLLRRGRRPAEAASFAEEEEAFAEGDAAAEAEAEADAEMPAAAPEVQAAARTSPTAAAAAARKVCPTCGERYGAEDQFCGADGTTLVPLNR
ncbi:hypothetical protein [Polyangium spumosum]|uniref:Zinc ribbon domain-containing protein n=1 Tax=Polyangium spumosum TaxID=889282 RepID=A0A6N7PPN0_9BACT|nr:hypothetical protein [Polyangium spumosum]MRG94018.1 hypothetical protein [Polyangium spumosum]